MEWKTRLPTFDMLTLPLLQFAADGEAHPVREAITAIADDMKLTDEQRNEMLPSGKKRTFDDRVQWANTYLKKSRLLESAGWGKFRITPRGLEVLRSNPTHINRKFLMRFPEFEEFIKGSRVTIPDDEISYLEYLQTPTDLIESAFVGIQQDLADDLLEIVMSCSPAFFE